MKIAITSEGQTLDSPMDRRFGRAAYFILIDDDGGDAFEAVENVQNLNAAQGAGIQSARTVVESGAKAVISGHVGPKAFATLSAGDVSVYTASAATVAEAADLYKAGKLARAGGADVEGHWV